MQKSAKCRQHKNLLRVIEIQRFGLLQEQCICSPQMVQCRNHLYAGKDWMLVLHVRERHKK